MFVVVAGTNRPGANTRKVAAQCAEMFRGEGADVRILDLADLPPELFSPASYAEKPVSFEPFQRAVLEAEGILTVVPEYNGGYPGVMKYFIDMLRFPESLRLKPAAFVGLSAGRWGALRGLEQLEMIFQYRSAHLFGRRVFLPGIDDRLDAAGRLDDADGEARLRQLVREFVPFARAAGRRSGAGGSESGGDLQ